MSFFSKNFNFLLNMNLQPYKDKIQQLKGRRQKIQEELTTSQAAAKAHRRELRNAEKAQVIIQLTAQSTQDELRYQLSELPKLALQSVFEDPYDFEVSFEIKRSKVEVDFWFVREGARINPKDNSGLGSVDIAGLALRPALWSLRSPRNRASIWLDEPFKHLKGAEANRRALAMLSEICKPRPEKNWPGLQIVMIADERASREDLLEVADCIYEFSMRGRQTIVKRLK